MLPTKMRRLARVHDRKELDWISRQRQLSTRHAGEDRRRTANRDPADGSRPCAKIIGEDDPVVATVPFGRLCNAPCYNEVGRRIGDVPVGRGKIRSIELPLIMERMAAQSTGQDLYGGVCTNLDIGWIRSDEGSTQENSQLGYPAGH